MVKVYFDGTEVENPVEWRELAIAVKYSVKDQITTFEFPNEMTFVKDAYEYLHSRIDSACSLIDVDVRMLCNGNWERVVYGVIFIGDCSFKLLECSVQVKIQDDAFSARIKNNYNVKVGLGLLETKNGLPITPPVHRSILFFEPSAGSWVSNVKSYDVFECFKFLVSWMTDNTVRFKSDFFETGDGLNDAFTSGVNIRTLSAASPLEGPQPPAFKFKELFEVMRKVRNVGMGFGRDIDGVPFVRIEELGYFRNAANAIDLVDVNKAELSFVQELLYAYVDMGSEITRPSQCNSGDDNCEVNNIVSYYGFDYEEYAFNGECNQDTFLDLKIKQGYIVDTNTIEDVLTYNNKSYDDDNFLINWFENGVGDYRAVQTDLLTTGNYWYNVAYTNREILARHLAYLQGSLQLYGLYSGINIFKAQGNVVSATQLPEQTPLYLQWSPDLNQTIYDPQNRFTTFPNDRFTPVDSGSYQFYCFSSMEEQAGGASSAGVQVLCQHRLLRYDQAGVLVDTYFSPIVVYVTGSSSPTHMPWTSDWIPFDEGDYMEWDLSYAQDLPRATHPTFMVFGDVAGGLDKHIWSCVDSRVAVNDRIETGGQLTRTKQVSSEHPIAWSDFSSYLSDTAKQIRLANQHFDRTGWARNVTHSIVSGKTEIDIITPD